MLFYFFTSEDQICKFTHLIYSNIYQFVSLFDKDMCILIGKAQK